VTNCERAGKLLNEVENLYAEVENALKRGSWNIALRRAQEVVEATLKGLLALMGADYPKEHDPSQVFARVVRERGLEVPDETLKEIQALSAALAEKRAPAFYFEIDISPEEARQAAEGAAKVLQLGLDLKARLLPSAEEEPLTKGQEKE
jgi:HEPN domain-containing protein